MELHLVGNMTRRKIHTIITCSFVALFQVFVFESTGVADTGMEFSAPPPFITEGAPPLVMLAMGRDHKLYYEAYNDASDLDEDAHIITYPFKCLHSFIRRDYGFYPCQRKLSCVYTVRGFCL